MKERLENRNPLAELIRSQREEIENYRWIESEKAGRDIGWKRALREQGILHPLFEILWSQQQEIESYKWIESEKRGHDIGWMRAVTEWQDRHYGEWKTHVMHGSPDDSANAKGVAPLSAPRKLKRAFSEEHRQKLASAMQAWHGKRKSKGSGSRTQG